MKVLGAGVVLIGAVLLVLAFTPGRMGSPSAYALCFAGPAVGGLGAWLMQRARPTSRA